MATEKQLRSGFGSWYKVDPTTRCWLWIRGKLSSGYGVVSIDQRAWVAHRAMYTIYKGPIPEGESVMHKCGNRLCVNPDHLRLDTRDERPYTKLTEHQAREIIALKGKMKLREVAEKYGTSESNVCNIQAGRHWKHLQETSTER